MAVNQSPASTQRPTRVTATLRPSAAPGKPRLVMSHKEAKSFDGLVPSLLLREDRA